MNMLVRNLIAKFSGESTMQIREVGTTEKYLATKEWQHRFDQTRDCWEKRCNGETTQSGSVRQMVRYWQSRSA
jgi:hypothetical protein